MMMPFRMMDTIFDSTNKKEFQMSQVNY